MQRGKFKSIWERKSITEKIARQLYKLQGCDAPEEPIDYMEKSEHPQERACYNAAVAAIDELMRQYP